MSNATDTVILDKFYARDETALSDCSEQYGRLCMSVALSLLHDRSDAEECVNDTWLKAWQLIPPARPPVLSCFLAKITRRLAIDRWRAAHSRRRDRNLEVALDELEDLSPAEETPELRDDLNEFLASLPPDERNLFIGRYWYGYAVGLLADTHGYSPNAVTKRLARTRDKLRQFLTERGYTL